MILVSTEEKAPLGGKVCWRMCTQGCYLGNIIKHWQYSRCPCNTMLTSLEIFTKSTINSIFSNYVSNCNFNSYDWNYRASLSEKMESPEEYWSLHSAVQQMEVGSSDVHMPKNEPSSLLHIINKIQLNWSIYLNVRAKTIIVPEDRRKSLWRWDRQRFLSSNTRSTIPNRKKNYWICIKWDTSAFQKTQLR